MRESVSAFDRGEVKDLETLKSFQLHMSSIQRDSVYWLHTVVPTMYDITRVNVNDYAHWYVTLL